MSLATLTVSWTSPIVAVRDVVASVAFYETCLGLQRALYNPDHGFALVKLGNLMVSFMRARDQAALGATANNGSTQLWMNDAASYYDEIKDRFPNHPYLAPTGPIDCEDGVPKLHIKDLDGF